MRLNRTPNAEIGGPDSFAAYGRHWAETSNTPYRKYKKYTHEGGTLTPLIAYWPAGLETPGRITHQPAHIMDVFSTVLDLAGLADPESDCAEPATELPSRSLLPLLRGGTADPDRPIFLEHEGHQAVRIGDWKLVRSRNRPGELYHLGEDPSEVNDLVSQHPERVQKMKQAYQNWMEANNVRPWPLKGYPGLHPGLVCGRPVGAGVEISDQFREIETVFLWLPLTLSVERFMLNVPALNPKKVESKGRALRLNIQRSTFNAQR